MALEIIAGSETLSGLGARLYEHRCGSCRAGPHKHPGTVLSDSLSPPHSVMVNSMCQLDGHQMPGYQAFELCYQLSCMSSLQTGDHRISQPP